MAATYENNEKLGRIKKGDFIMNVGIRILVENTTPIPGLLGEYGFAALINVDDQAFLFDTGSGQALLANASNMGLNLADVPNLVISHGHFDHTGAVLSFLQTGTGKTVYCHSAVFTQRYAVAGEFKREISALCTQDQILDTGAKLIFTDSFTEIYPGVFLTGTVPRRTEFEDVGGNFMAEQNGNLVKDELQDDIAMVVNHPDGLIIISGCAHAGLINILDYAREKTGQQKVRAFIGGTHLISASPERLAKTVDYLKKQTVEQLIPCHCTGFPAAAYLSQALGSTVIKGETGMFFQY